MRKNITEEEGRSVRNDEEKQGQLKKKYEKKQEEEGRQ